MSENTSETESKRTVYFCAGATRVGNEVGFVHECNNNNVPYLIPVSIPLGYLLYESSSAHVSTIV